MECGFRPRKHELEGSLPTLVMIAKGLPQKIYSAGTLRYSVRGLCILFAWLLWGDFAFTFFESIFGRFIPLYLKDMQASNTLIGIMTGSIAGGVNLFFLPGISQWSDRCRTRWGRRIPFLVVMTPLTVAALILVGFAPELGTWLHHRVFLHFAPTVSVGAVILTLLCVWVVFFHYFNMVLVSTFTWLLRDVVPLELMARFLSWFRIISTLSSMAFSWYVFPYVISHRKGVCVGVGMFYLVMFSLMCWKVKEGKYPSAPPPENKPGVIKAFAIYYRECFSISLYRNYFLAIILTALGGCAGPFFLLFYRNTLGLSMQDLGSVFVIGAGSTALAYLPIGWLCDRFNPISVSILAQAGLLLMTILSFFYIKDKSSLILFTVIVSIISVGWGLGSATLTMKLFPSEKFGQFSAGVNVFACGIGIVGNYLIGILMDLVNSNYRMAYLWAAIGGLSLLPMIFVYRGWRHHGGPHQYIPPLPE